MAGTWLTTKPRLLVAVEYHRGLVVKKSPQSWEVNRGVNPVGSVVYVSQDAMQTESSRWKDRDKAKRSGVDLDFLNTTYLGNVEGETRVKGEGEAAHKQQEACTQLIRVVLCPSAGGVQHAACGCGSYVRKGLASPPTPHTSHTHPTKAGTTRLCAGFSSPLWPLPNTAGCTKKEKEKGRFIIKLKPKRQQQEHNITSD